MTAAEGAECIGGQLARNGDRNAALLAALFVDHLQQMYPTAFDGQLGWGARLPAGKDLGQIVFPGLNGADSRYLYEGIDAVADTLPSDARCVAFLGRGKGDQA